MVGRRKPRGVRSHSAYFRCPFLRSSDALHLCQAPSQRGEAFGVNGGVHVTCHELQRVRDCHGFEVGPVRRQRIEDVGMVAGDRGRVLQRGYLGEDRSSQSPREGSMGAKPLT